MINTSLNNSNNLNQNKYFGKYTLPKGTNLQFIQYNGPNAEWVKQRAELPPQKTIDNIQKIATQNVQQSQKVEDVEVPKSIIKPVYVKLRYLNGDFYEGDFLNECPHGNGKVTYSDGLIYEGTWWNGMPEGKGTFVYQNGALMHVRHVQGLIHGVAIITYLNKDVDYLSFNYGKLHGTRKLCYENGMIFEEIWEYGKRNNLVKIFFKDCLELFYWGESQNLQPHGFGKMFYNDGSIVEGNWEKGILIQNPVPTAHYQAPSYPIHEQASFNSFEETFKNAFEDENAYYEFCNSLKNLS